MKIRYVSDDLIEGAYTKPIGRLTERELNNFVWSLMDDENNLLETFSDEDSLDYHYDKHVKKKDDLTNNHESRSKYDYMLKDDYYKYANKLSHLKPTMYLKKGDLKEDAEDIIDDFIDSTNNVLIINGLKHKNGHNMFAVFNRKSAYSKRIDLCLYDLDLKDPISLYPVSPGNVGVKANRFLFDDEEEDINGKE